MRNECNAIFLFIAELTGSFEAGTGTVDDKLKCGQQDYINQHLHDLDLTKEEDRKEVHQNVWLERLYNELDCYFELPKGNKVCRALALDIGAYRTSSYQWSVPIELDASASVCQFLGVLLGDKRLMEMTNVIGDTLQDPWKLDGIPRSMLKTAATPMLYASSKSCSELWRDAKIDFTPEHVALYNKEMSEGAFGLANMFKEFLVNNCQPKPVMDVHVGSDEFTVYCNRFRNVGEKTKAYKIWDSVDERYNIVLHTDTKKVPDLEQFRRFWPTCLVHNLDSQVMNNVVNKVMNKYGWGIPVHDAILISPAAADDVRQWYAEELEGIYENRSTILQNFFTSIGITGAAKAQWDKLKAKIVAFEGDFKVSAMALK